jgi:replicative DNA helicase
MDDLIPWSSQSEMAVLGALLIENKRWDTVAHILKPEHFYDFVNGKIFTAIAALMAQNKPADALTVHEQLVNQGDEKFFEEDYLSQLANQYLPSERNTEAYANHIVDKFLQRGLASAADKVRELSVSPGLSIEERISQSQAELAAVQPRSSQNVPMSMQTHVPVFLERLEALYEGRIDPGMPTGLNSLDKMLGGGFKPGKQIIIAARPSVGKSSFAEQLCLNVAGAGFGAAFLSQEMGCSELTERAVANLGRIKLDNLQTGKLEEFEWTRLTDAMESIKNLPLYFDDQPSLSLFDIQSKARALKRKYDIKLLVIDYIQLCAGAKDSSRHHQIEELSRGLKGLAKQLDITIITLSQLNREVEKRTSGRPVLSDLKESGSIEEDADIVMLLSRNPQNNQIINCEVPKNRQGKVGSLSMSFDGALQKWEETSGFVGFSAPPKKHYTEDL